MSAQTKKRGRGVKEATTKTTAAQETKPVPKQKKAQMNESPKKQDAAQTKEKKSEEEGETPMPTRLLPPSPKKKTNTDVVHGTLLSEIKIIPAKGGVIEKGVLMIESKKEGCHFMAASSSYITEEKKNTASKLQDMKHLRTNLIKNSKTTTDEAYGVGGKTHEIGINVKLELLTDEEMKVLTSNRGEDATRYDTIKEIKDKPYGAIVFFKAKRGGFTADKNENTKLVGKALLYNGDEQILVATWNKDTDFVKENTDDNYFVLGKVKHYRQETSVEEIIAFQLRHETMQHFKISYAACAPGIAPRTQTLNEAIAIRPKEMKWFNADFEIVEVLEDYILLYCPTCYHPVKIDEETNLINCNNCKKNIKDDEVTLKANPQILFKLEDGSKHTGRLAANQEVTVFGKTIPELMNQAEISPHINVKMKGNFGIGKSRIMVAGIKKI